jgi:putative salt-induced outer membrane protein YdiY
MKTTILTIGFSAMLVVASGTAWAQTTAVTTNQPQWHGDGAFGLALARGNANTFLMNGSATADRAWGPNDFKLGADGQYGLNDWGKTNQTRSTEAVHGFMEYKRLFTERLYGSARVDGFHDDIADLRYRVIVGPALGYYFIKSDATKLNGEFGPSFIDEKQGADTHKYLTVRFMERCEHTFNKAKTAKAWEEVDYLPQVDDTKNYLLNSEVGVEAALSARFSLRVCADDKFNSMPEPGAKENDITLISSLVYKY